MTRRTEALIFDFGGVFTDSPFAAVRHFGAELGAGAEEITEIVFGSYRHDGDHPWHRLERGEISLELARELIRDIGRARSFDVDVYQLFARMAGNGAGSSARQSLVDKVRLLRAAGYRTGMITNNVREFGQGWRSLIPVDELFEFVIDSSEVGVRKPDRRIYELALAELGGIAAERCVYLDDYPANLDSARELGMRCVHVGADVDAAITELERLI